MKKILRIAFSLLCLISPFINQLIAQDDISVDLLSGRANDISLTYAGKAIKFEDKLAVFSLQTFLSYRIN